MAGKATSSVDGKGRVLIPQSLRDALNMGEGEKVLLSLEGGALRIEPSHEKKLLRLRILLSDSPGALAHAASALSKLGVDLVSTQSHSSRRGEAAEWMVECNPGGKTASEIKAALGKVGAKLLEAAWG